MSIYDFAKNELEILEKQCGDDEEALQMQKIVTKDVLEIIQILVEQSHTGFSMGYIFNLLSRLVKYKPLTPLTGEEDEWEDCSEFGVTVKQNRRCPSVFKRPDGSSYWAEGKMFTEDEGKSWYTNKDSVVDVTFPFSVPNYSESVYVPKVNVED